MKIVKTKLTHVTPAIHPCLGCNDLAQVLTTEGERVWMTWGRNYKGDAILEDKRIKLADSPSYEMIVERAEMIDALKKIKFVVDRTRKNYGEH